MTIRHCNAEPYEPKELTDYEINQERKVQIGQNFYRLQNMRPEINSGQVDPIRYAVNSYITKRNPCRIL